MYTLGAYIGTETINVEFKELRLNKLLSKSNEILSESDAYNIVNNNNKFVELCEMSLYLYLNDYIPRYFTSFLNNESIDSGTIFIGVSDFGEVIGLPIEEKRVVIVKKRAESLLSTLLEQIEDQLPICNINLLSLCKINVLKINNVNHVPHKDFELSDVIKYAKIEMDTYSNISNTYAESRRLVTEQIMYYHLSINRLLTESRFKNELKCFVIEKGVNTLTALQLQNIIDQLDGVSKFYKAGQIASEKRHIHNLAYWITSFRERMSKRLSSDKPRHFTLHKPMTPYKRVLNEFVPIVHRLFEKKYKCVSFNFFSNKRCTYSTPFIRKEIERHTFIFNQNRIRLRNVTKYMYNSKIILC